MYESKRNKEIWPKKSLMCQLLNTWADLSRLWVDTSVFKRLQKFILCGDLSNTCVNTYWINFEKFKNLILCAYLYKLCVDTWCPKLEIFWHMWIWDDLEILNLTHAWLIDERHMHMIVFHDLLANNMQTHKCKHEIVKDVDQMWRYLEWGHYKHVKWNT